MSFVPSPKMSHDSILKHFSENTVHLNSLTPNAKASFAEITLHSSQDVRACDETRKSTGSWSFSASKEALSYLKGGKRLQTGFDENSTITHAITENEDICGGEDDADGQDSVPATLADLRELCWLVLSSATTALREYSRLSKHVDSTSGSGCVAPGLDVQAAQDRVSQATARLQQFVVEVCIKNATANELFARILQLEGPLLGARIAEDAEAECLRLCTLLNSLLQNINCVLSAAGLEHLVDIALVSPRRSSAQRLVEAACSDLELLGEELKRRQVLQQQQVERIKQLEHHVIEGENKLLEATNKYDKNFMFSPMAMTSEIILLNT
ncbi:hypothetical protein FHG87_005646 [Trinorchestia longiramus]|nr:hypothetical protein FHG87_005646 [Trinorchestia longiramus]